MAKRRSVAKKRKLEEAEKLRKSVREAQERGRVPARLNPGPVPAGPLLPRPGGPVVCFGCGEAGHIRRNCPRWPVLAYPLLPDGIVHNKWGRVGERLWGVVT